MIDLGKIIASVSCTLDGIYTGPQGDENNMVSWAMPGIMDSTADNLVMFQNADAMNKTPKYVATRNREITEVNWGDFDNTISLLAGDLHDHIAALKREIQGSIIVPGSACECHIRLKQSMALN